MPNIPENPSGLGARQQRAAQLRAETERTNRMSSAPTTEAEAPAPAEEIAETCPPVGQGDYVVKEGDCISSIAVNKGHFWETIWNDGGNAELKEERKDPNVLLPGDLVAVPEKEKKQEPGASEQRHRFCRKGEPTELYLRVLEDGKPRGNQPYIITVEGEEHSGSTDPEGMLHVPIHGRAKTAHLCVGEQPNQVEYNIKLGNLNPIEDVSGVQARLHNMGFGCEVTGTMDEDTLSAANALRARRELPPVTELNQETKDIIVNEHLS